MITRSSHHLSQSYPLIDQQECGVPWFGQIQNGSFGWRHCCLDVHKSLWCGGFHERHCRIFEWKKIGCKEFQRIYRSLYGNIQLNFGFLLPKAKFTTAIWNRVSHNYLHTIIAIIFLIICFSKLCIECNLVWPLMFNHDLKIFS